jgi:hypothetical protein
MGTIREVPKKGGEVSYHAEVRVKGSRPQRASFRTRTLAKKWIQDFGLFLPASAIRKYELRESGIVFPGKSEMNESLPCRSPPRMDK